ncbi:hypothetical protein QEV70_02925 [Trueperella pyogenes]|uniref:hypothetical protein n=1 Tax=Trueperella pyogenes TaxID=1661 RepID=UPI00324C5C2C
MTENVKTPMTRSLEKSTLEIERHVATGGWDAPMRLFALALAKNALDTHPELVGELPADVQAQAITDETTLFSIEQEGLPEVESVEELLGRIVGRRRRRRRPRRRAHYPASQRRGDAARGPG